MARKPSTSPKESAASPPRIAVLYGPEEMLKREALDRLRSEIESVHGEAEVMIYDGKSASLADVLDELRSFSLMQRHKIVIVDDADVFVAAHREALVRYAEAPVESALLLLRAGKWNKGNLDKLIEKVGFITKCEPLPPGEVRRWLVTRAEKVHGRKLDPRAVELLAERLGGDLSLIDSELGKLAVMVKDNEPIGVALVEQLVGRSSEEEAWAVQEAVLQSLAGRRGEVIEKLHELIDLSGQPDILVAYFVADLVRKLHVAAQMKRQGANDRAIATELKLWGPRAELFAQVLRKLPATKTAELFDRIIEMDVRSKTGRGEATRNLECFFATLSDEMV
ncbi:MAG: DNA polymerase III subunit delta [Planctomycetes bacterium]|nr:DNA polymerase III subunit delta [Planctomycetota bacterium]